MLLRSLSLLFPLLAATGSWARSVAPITATSPLSLDDNNSSTPKVTDYCKYGHGFMCSVTNDYDLMYCRTDNSTVVYAGSCPHGCIRAPNGIADSCVGSNAPFRLPTKREGRFCGKDIHMATDRIYFYMDNIGSDLGVCEYGCRGERDGIPAHCRSAPSPRRSSDPAAFSPSQESTKPNATELPLTEDISPSPFQEPTKANTAKVPLNGDISPSSTSLLSSHTIPSEEA
ncbi:MAG: hypothetical protein DHS80DRAFT_21277 [Piptocephalis tieghemiana]|nr:MAG: hypothetical protein DHS80DRAFT_21277 [Piptocephalis tieghemiana]